MKKWLCRFWPQKTIFVRVGWAGWSEMFLSGLNQDADKASHPSFFEVVAEQYFVPSLEVSGVQQSARGACWLLQSTRVARASGDCVAMTCACENAWGYELMPPFGCVSLPALLSDPLTDVCYFNQHRCMRDRTRVRPWESCL